MAYNVLKGNVAGSVDQHADQEINGVKVFKSTISASVFYDTDAQSPCATLKDVALHTIVGNVPNSVLVLGREGVAYASPQLSYDDGELTVDTVCAGSVHGDGSNLTNLSTDALSSPITATQLKLGAGLKSVNGALALSLGSGLSADAKCTRLNVVPQGGLTLSTNALGIDPTKLQNIKRTGQSVAADDLLIVGNQSMKNTYGITLKDLYEDYLSLKMPRPKGVRGSLQLKGKGTLDASENLTYNATSNILRIGGEVNADTVHIHQRLVCTGAVHKNITTVSEMLYVVGDDDYTVLCDTTKNKVLVTLPSAATCPGRLLVVKNINRGKANQKTLAVVIESEGELVDLKKRVEIRTRGTTKTLQSDGRSWWAL